MLKKKALGFLSVAVIAGCGTVAASLPAFAADPASSSQQPVAQKYQHHDPLQKISSIIGVDVKTLRADLKAGQSIAEIAQSKGISEETLISDLQAQLKEQLDQAVANGKITADKENSILEKSGAKFQKLVEHKGVLKEHKEQKGEPLKEVASVLGIDVKTLRDDLKAGQSIAEIAQSKGISEQTLISDLQGKLKSRLDQAVANGKLTSDKESQILEKSTERLKKLVEQKGLYDHEKQQQQQQQQQQ